MDSTRAWLRALTATAALASAGALALGGSSLAATGTPHHSERGQSATVALDETFAGFNILTSADNGFDLQQIMENVWPSVFTIDDKLRVVLDSQFVTRAVQTSAKPQTIVYTINPKATWADGVPITAADFIYNWRAQSGRKHVVDKGGKPYDDATTSGYNQISSITGSNRGKTVTVRFATPYADWKSLFGPIVPAHVAERVGWNTGFNTAKNVLSGGPYEIASYKPNQFLVLKRNPHYWGTPARLATLNFQWVGTDDSEPTGLESGELSVINPASVSQSLATQANRIATARHETLPGLQFEHLDFNEANPYLAKTAVRQAIAFGTNRKRIIADVVGALAPKTQPLGNRMLMPNQPGYVNNGRVYDTVNDHKARTLLSRLGFRFVNGYFEPNYGPEAGQPLTFTISSTTGNPVRQETEQLFQADMQRVGIRIRIQNYDTATFFGTNIPTGQFDIAEFAWVSTPFVSGNESMYCSYTLGTMCGANFDRYANPSVTKLLVAGADATNPTAEVADYNRADAMLWRDMVTLPLYQTPEYFAWSKALGRVLPNPSSEGITWNAARWTAR